jgi:hypothetical protein
LPNPTYEWRVVYDCGYACDPEIGWFCGCLDNVVGTGNSVKLRYAKDYMLILKATMYNSIARDTLIVTVDGNGTYSCLNVPYPQEQCGGSRLRVADQDDITVSHKGGAFSIALDAKLGENVRITAYDVSGRLAEKIYGPEMARGKFSVDWSPAKLKSGIYFLRVEVGSRVKTQRAVVIR